MWIIILAAILYNSWFFTVNIVFVFESCRCYHSALFRVKIVLKSPTPWIENSLYTHNIPIFKLKTGYYYHYYYFLFFSVHVRSNNTNLQIYLWFQNTYNCPENVIILTMWLVIKHETTRREFVPQISDNSWCFFFFFKLDIRFGKKSWDCIIITVRIFHEKQNNTRP